MADSTLPQAGQPAAPTRQWHVTAFLAPQDHSADRELVHSVHSVRALRARILFDYGRRPEFLRADGAHTDDQDLDFGAWHFIARSEAAGPPLGYVRLCTPASGALFQSRTYLGAARYEALLQAHGVAMHNTFEHSRLVVEHSARKLGLGLYLNALAIGAAHQLGAAAMIGTSGTKDGQDRFHERFGFRPVSGTRGYVAQYTEDVVVMVQRVADGAGQQHQLVAQLREKFSVIAAADLSALMTTASTGGPAPG